MSQLLKIHPFLDYLKKNIKKVFKITDLDKLFNLGDDEWYLH